MKKEPMCEEERCMMYLIVGAALMLLEILYFEIVQ